MILCCGEALIDMIPCRTASGETGFVPHAGGSVFNTAIALARLGAAAGLLAGLSRDMFGRRIETTLRDSGVDTGFLVRSDRPSTLAFVHLDDGQAIYDFYDENSALRALRPADLPDLPPQPEALFFGGISLCNPPGAETLAALAENRAGRATIMFDPNIRPGFSEDEAAYRARLERMMRCCDILKLSHEDIDWIRPGPGPAIEKARRLVQMSPGPDLVLLTRGGAGASAVHAGGPEISVPAVAAEIVDTVGAGDTFNAGVLAMAAETGLLEKPALRAASAGQLRAIVEFGARAASVTVSRTGANPPWAHELPAAPAPAEVRK